MFAGDQGIPAGLFHTTYGYFEPRVGIDWAITPKTSVRGAFGLFSTPMEDDFYNRVWDANPFAQSYNAPTSASMPDPFDAPWSVDAATGGVSPFPPFFGPRATIPPNVAFSPAGPIGLPAVFDRNLKLGMTESWNVSIDHQFPGKVATHMAYVGSESYHQAMTVDQNPGQFYAVGNPNNGNRAAYPDFQEIFQVEDGGTANYHSLQAGIEKALSHGFQAQSHFTWSKTFDLSFSGDPIFGTSVSDPKDPAHDHGLSALNVPIAWASSVIYHAPKFKRGSKQMRNVLSGWEISGLYRASSGPSFSINGGNGNNNSFLDEYQDRADVVPGVPVNVRKRGRSHWLNEYMNPAAFTENALGTPGNVPKFSIQQPPIQDADAALLKSFAYRERYNLQLRFEAFNVFNHPSFAQPDAEAGDPGFGQITAPGRSARAGCKGRQSSHSSQKPSGRLVVVGGRECGGHITAAGPTSNCALPRLDRRRIASRAAGEGIWEFSNEAYWDLLEAWGRGGSPRRRNCRDSNPFLIWVVELCRARSAPGRNEYGVPTSPLET